MRGIEAGRCRCEGVCPRSVGQLRVAAVVDAYGVHDAKVGKGNAVARAGATEDVATVPAVVLAVREGKGGATSHANVRVGPLWGLFSLALGVEDSSVHIDLGTYCAAVKHAAGDVFPGWELVALALQAPVDLVDIAQVAAPLGGSGPGLYELQHFVPDVVVGPSAAGRLHQGGHVVEELARRYLLDEVGAAVLDAGIRELARMSACLGS